MTAPLPEAERAARCAWVCYRQARIDGSGEETVLELISETKVTLWALDDEARARHLGWRARLDSRLELVLNSFCPGGGDCCDAVFWPKQPTEGDESGLVAQMKTLVQALDNIETTAICRQELGGDKANADGMRRIAAIAGAALDAALGSRGAKE